jgi:hypothetical protein
MTESELAAIVIDHLEAVGGIASDLYEIPRSTRDADFVVSIGTGELGALDSAAVMP